MPVIDHKMITQKLNVDPQFKLVKQKRNQIINKEVETLEINGLIREVHYPDWLVNVVVVKKKRKN